MAAIHCYDHFVESNDWLSYLLFTYICYFGQFWSSTNSFLMTILNTDYYPWGVFSCLCVSHVRFTDVDSVVHTCTDWGVSWRMKRLTDRAGRRLCSDVTGQEAVRNSWNIDFSSDLCMPCSEIREKHNPRLSGRLLYILISKCGVPASEVQVQCDVPPSGGAGLIRRSDQHGRIHPRKKKNRKTWD